MIVKRSLLLLTLSAAALLCAGARAQDEPAAATPAVTAVTPETAPAAEPALTEPPAVPEEKAEAPADAPAEEASEAQAVSETPAEALAADQETAALKRGGGISIPALALDVPVEKDIHDQLLLRKPSVNIDKMPSLFFTVWERDLIITARKGLQTRDPNVPEEIIEAAVPKEEDKRPSMFDNPRDLSLNGIVFHSSKDWVVWLNAKRIAPNALPKEILDIKVYKEYIDLKWFDESTNQIYPIRLRPHQRFNLDTRVFLPG